jgi:hypothetical protein
MAKYSASSDPAWATGISNIAALFDPKAQAEGAAMLARTKSFDADTRYNTARAAGVEDQNSALSDAVLAGAGYSPAEIAAIRATRPSSVNDIFKGRNTYRGGNAIEAGNLVTGLALTDQGTAIKPAIEGQTQQKLLTNPDGSFNTNLAALLAGGVENVGGNMVYLTPQGYKLGDLTAQGNLYNTQGVNDTAQTASRNLVDTARAGAITKTGDATVDLREAQAGAVTTTAESKAENALKLTEAQIELLRKKGVSVEDLTNAKVGTEGAKQGAITQGAGDKTRETDARINRINANINNDAVKATAASANGVDPVKREKATLDLREAIEGVYSKDFSESTGKNVWEQVDPAQKKSLTDRALQYVLQGKDVGSAMKQSEADHGLTGKTVKGQKSSGFLKLFTSPDGKITFEGFTAPSALASAVTGGSTPAAPAAAPAPFPATFAPPPVTAPAASAEPVKITNDDAGKAAFARLPSGTPFIDPNGTRRIKP